MKRLILPGLIVLLTLSACFSGPTTATLLDRPKPLQDFELENVDGGTIRLSDFAGRTLLVYFGYTFCPDFCPATLYDIQQARIALGAKSADFDFLMITVDPQRDSAEQLERYVHNFDPAFYGARTDDPALLDPVLADFGAFYMIEAAEDSAASYLVTHTVAVFLVNPQGQLAGVWGADATAEDFAADLRRLLR